MVRWLSRITVAWVGVPFFCHSRIGRHIGEYALRASWRYRTGWRWRRATPRDGHTFDRSRRRLRHRYGRRPAASSHLLRTPVGGGSAPQEDTNPIVLHGGLPGLLDGALLLDRLAGLLTRRLSR